MPDTRLNRAVRARWHAVLVLAFAALLAFSACGGDDDDDDGGDSDPVTAQLVDLSERWSAGSGRVVYDVTTADGGEVTAGGMILYWSPPNFRYDIVTSESGDDVATIIISTPEESYFCTSQPDGEGFCFAQDGGNEATAGLPFLSDFSDPDAIRASIDELGKDAKFEASSREVAGINATLFRRQRRADRR